MENPRGTVGRTTARVNHGRAGAGPGPTSRLVAFPV